MTGGEPFDKLRVSGAYNSQYNPRRPSVAKARFIEVEVEEGNNCDYSLHRVFSVVDDPQEVVRVEAPGIRGELAMVEVVGWSENGPCPAYAAIVEDSGEGHALLIFGGDDGIRTRPVGSDSEWSLDDPTQTGEPCLLLDKTTPYTPATQ